MAFARAGAIIGGYNSYSSTDEGLLTDGGTLIAVGILVLVLPAFLGSRRLGKRRALRLALLTIGLEGLCLVLLCAFALTGEGSGGIRFALSTATSLFSWFSTFYWLRRIRGTSPVTATVIIFSALIISELALYTCYFLPLVVAYLIGAVLVLFQFFFLLKARTKSKRLQSTSQEETRDYFRYAKTRITSKQFLIVTAIGVILLAIVIGFLRGYPNGQPIAFTPEARFAYMALTIVISVGLMYFGIKGKQGVMGLGIWIVMQVLATLALICYVAFPDALYIGAVFTTTLNALMVGLSQYIIVAFMGYGWRDPYYYAIGGFVVWLGSRALTRTLLLSYQPLQDNGVLMCVLAGALLLLSAQVFNVQYLSMTNNQNKDELEKATSQKNALGRIMGLDENESLSDMRRSSMGLSVAEVGRQFLLTERETEVLTLYALGFTQKSVAEELHISQGTVHTHIKKVFSKTDIHSRQQLLDYIKQYTV